MRRTIFTLCATAAMGLAVVGCKNGMMGGDKMAATDGMVTDMTVGDKDMMAAAPVDGMYYLVPPGTGSRPMFSTYLKKGEMMGFKKMPNGRMMAMAGDKTMDVTSMQVMWQHGMVR